MPLIVPGLASAQATTPDHSSLAITDLDVRIRLSMGFWGPLFLSAHLIGQGVDVGDRGWVLSIHPNQRVRLAIYPDGTNLVGPESTVSLTYPGDLAVHWLRATVAATNGTNSVWDYYTSESEDGTTWTPLGTQQLLAPTSIFNSTATLGVPPDGLGYLGRVYYAEVRNGIGGTIVANPDFAAQAPGTTSFNDSTGKTWTVGLNIDSGIPAQQIGVLA